MSNPKTQRVRILCWIDECGQIEAASTASTSGVSCTDDELRERLEHYWVDSPDVLKSEVWIEATVPLPEPQVVEGEVSDG